MKILKSLKGRDFLKIQDYSKEELWTIIKLAQDLKVQYYAGKKIIPFLSGKSIGLIFQKPSTRTRISFEVAVYQLGGNALYLNWNDLQLGRGETISDTGKVLSRYLDGIMARVYSQKDLEILATAATIPVINGLSDLYHPCQALSDLLTIYEKKGYLEGLNLTFIGDGSDNMCHSLIVASTKMGMNITISSPKEYEPNEKILEMANSNAKLSGSKIKIINSPEDAVKDADIIYTDVWVSMGQEKETKKRIEVFPPYQVNRDLIRHAPNDVMVMHCLPAHRGLEITDEVIDSEMSIVWDQAENRLHLQKAILALLI